MELATRKASKQSHKNFKGMTTANHFQFIPVCVMIQHTNVFKQTLFWYKKKMLHTNTNNKNKKSDFLNKLSIVPSLIQEI